MKQAPGTNTAQDSRPASSFLANHLEPHALEIAALTDDTDAEACADLWRRVIGMAARDLRFIRNSEGRELTRFELKRLDRIEESSPADFLEGPWFDVVVCEFLGMDAGELRDGFERLGERVERVA